MRDSDEKKRVKPALTQTCDLPATPDFDSLGHACCAPNDLEWCLVLGFHPDFARIGQRSAVPFTGQALQVGRTFPDFDPLGTGPRASGIGDRYVSRSAFSLEPDGGGWRLFRDPGRSRLRLNGREIQREVPLTETQLRSGLVLTLAQRVVLHLRLQPKTAHCGASTAPLNGLLGVSPAMQQLRSSIQDAARAAGDVLLTGPTGTGKELVARAIHQLSDRAAGPWVAVNVAALPVEIAAASLFGARRGAYTGADSHRRGCFQEAQGGTLFLDEVGDAPESLQPMLLRALQEREVQVVGGASQRVDLRVISAMEHDPDDPENGLRPALRHRLGALEIRLPALRDRVEDVGLLAAAELSSHRRQSPLCSGDTANETELASWARCFELLHSYHWPGNVRELQHAVQQISTASTRRLHIPATLLQRFRAAHAEADDRGGPAGEVQERREPPRRFADVSDEEFIAAWREERFEVAALARRFGVSRPAIYRRLKDIPECRLAADVPLGELLAVLDACRGDLSSTAERLAVSRRGLEARLRATGVRSAAAAPVTDPAADADRG